MGTRGAGATVKKEEEEKERKKEERRRERGRSTWAEGKDVTWREREREGERVKACRQSRSHGRANGSCQKTETNVVCMCQLECGTYRR